MAAAASRRVRAHPFLNETNVARSNFVAVMNWLAASDDRGASWSQRGDISAPGIRGRANSQITADMALKVGQAAGLAFRRGDHRHRVVIGKDTRLSSYMIEYALVAGFASVGADVLLLGPAPTPAVAMLTRSMRCDLGAMSASRSTATPTG
jgi:phosphoglucosamine mutase